MTDALASQHSFELADTFMSVWSEIDNPDRRWNRPVMGAYNEPFQALLMRVMLSSRTPDGKPWLTAQDFLLEMLHHAALGYDANWCMKRMRIKRNMYADRSRLNHFIRSAYGKRLIEAIQTEISQSYEELLSDTERLAWERVRDNLQGEDVSRETLENAWNVIRQKRGAPKASGAKEDEPSGGSNLAAITAAAAGLGHGLVTALAGRLGPVGLDQPPIDVEARDVQPDQPETDGVAGPERPGVPAGPEPLARDPVPGTVPPRRRGGAKRQKPLRVPGASVPSDRKEDERGEEG